MKNGREKSYFENKKDIFLSYASEDRKRAKIIADALEKEGLSVFWDRNIGRGLRYRKIIEEKLDTAECVIVLWSENAVESDWVIDEATEGLRRNILIPVMIDDVKPPLGFRQIQFGNLINWNGTLPSPEFDQLVNDVTAITGRQAVSKMEPFPNVPKTAIEGIKEKKYEEKETRERANAEIPDLQEWINLLKAEKVKDFNRLREKYPEVKIDLHGMDFKKLNLADINLSKAVLTGTDFSKSNLSRSKFSNANLSGCNISGANLTGADFSNSDLSGAIFSTGGKAILNRANLSRINFSNADLSKADLSGAQLIDLDLRGANLSEVVFFRATAMGVKTDEKTIAKNIIVVHEEGRKDSNKIREAIEAFDEDLRNIILRDNKELKEIYTETTKPSGGNKAENLDDLLIDIKSEEADALISIARQIADWQEIMIKEPENQKANEEFENLKKSLTELEDRNSKLDDLRKIALQLYKGGSYKQSIMKWKEIEDIDPRSIIAKEGIKKAEEKIRQKHKVTEVENKRHEINNKRLRRVPPKSGMKR